MTQSMFTHVVNTNIIADPLAQNGINIGPKRTLFHNMW